MNFIWVASTKDFNLGALGLPRRAWSNSFRITDDERGWACLHPTRTRVISLHGAVVLADPAAK